MSESPANSADLLKVCFQDLYVGRRHAAEVLPTVAGQVGPDISGLIIQLADSFRDQASELEALDGVKSGPDNLWMGGILSDARRDTETIEPGPLRDIAIIGAIRKALVADEVSLETAEVIARSLSRAETARVLRNMRDRVQQMDQGFRRFLYEMNGFSVPHAV